MSVTLETEECDVGSPHAIPPASTTPSEHRIRLAELGLSFSSEGRSPPKPGDRGTAPLGLFMLARLLLRGLFNVPLPQMQKGAPPSTARPLF